MLAISKTLVNDAAFSPNLAYKNLLLAPIYLPLAGNDRIKERL